MLYQQSRRTSIECKLSLQSRSFNEIGKAKHMSREFSNQQQSIVFIQQSQLDEQLSKEILRSDNKMFSSKESSNPLSHPASVLMEFKDIFDMDDSEQSEKSDKSIMPSSSLRYMIMNDGGSNKKMSLTSPKLPNGANFNQEIQNMVNTNIKLKGKEKREYMGMLMELQDKFENHPEFANTKKYSSKSQVQKTIISALQQLKSFDSGLSEDSGMCDYESLEDCTPNKLPVQFQPIKKKESRKLSAPSYQNLVQQFMKQFFNEMDRQSAISESSLEVVSEESPSEEDTRKDTIQRLYERLYSRDPENDPYNLYMKSELDAEWLEKEFCTYKDQYYLLGIRKLLVRWVILSHQAIRKLVTSDKFLIFMACNIVYNMTTFVMFNLQNQYINISILILYAIEVTLKFIGLGILQFTHDSWNIVDTVVLANLLIYIINPEVIGVELSPIRIIRLLYLMGQYVKRLKIMIISLEESIQFLKEVLAIVFIFTLFFALCGLHLFNGLFRLKCHDNNTGIPINIMCGYDQECKPEQYCAYSSTNPQVPTHFDNFLYSYGQIIRVMIYNDWTEPTYFSMRTFHSSAVILYILVIFIAGIFGSNLMIAVLKIYYSETMKKYEYTTTEHSHAVNPHINLALIKGIKLREQIQLVELDYIWRSEFNQSLQTLRQSVELQNYARSATVKIPRNKTSKLLSARQAKLLEQGNILAKISKWEQYYKKHSLKDCLMPNKKFDKDVKAVIRKSEKLLPEHQFRLLMDNPYLAWKVEVSYQDHSSTSAQDIFTGKNKEMQRKNKQARELEFIRQAKPKHYFLVKLPEIQKYMELQKLRPRRKSSRMFPYRRHRHLKHQESQQKASVDSNNNIYYHSNRQTKRINSDGRLEQQRSDKRVNSIYLNGQEYNYEEIAVLINRNQEKEERIQLNDLERYVEFRLQECKKLLIVKHNNSCNDILPHFDLQRKVSIFKAFNSANSTIWINGLMGKLKVIRNHTVLFLRLKSVEQLFDFCVLLNVLFVCFESFLQQSYIAEINNALTLVLVFELLLKMVTLGLSKFAMRKLNLFDTFIILCSVVEIIIDAWFNINKYDKLFLKIMRAIQAILFYRIIKYNIFAVQVVIIIKQSFNSFLNLIVLMIFIITIFALVGMNLFKDKFPQDTENGFLHSFNDFPQSFMAVFDRSTSDDWYGLMIYGTTYGYQSQTMIYGITLVYVLNYMTFGLVLAIILDGFSNYQFQTQEEVDHKLKNINSEVSDEIKENLDRNITLKSDSDQHPSIGSGKKGKSRKYSNRLSTLKHYLRTFIDDQFMEYFTHKECKHSLYIFSQKNRFRRACYRLSMSRTYRLFINLVVIFSIFVMAQENSNLIDNDVALNLELYCNLLIFISLLIRIFTYGLMKDYGALTVDIWRFFDFVYTIVYLTVRLFNIEENAVMYTISRMKYMRPMRFMIMFSYLREMKYAMTKSLPDLINIFIVQLMVWFMFAIFGSIIYKNQFGYCEYPLNFNVGKQECLDNGQEWITFVHNYDNIFYAISTLYVISTGDGWGLIYQISYNSNFEELGPAPFANRWITYVFYFTYILIGSLFFMGFFTGILFINFQNNRNQLLNMDLTEDQMLFQQITEIILKEKPQYSSPPNSRIRKQISKLLENKHYRQIMRPILFAEALILAQIHFEADLEYMRILNIVYYSVIAFSVMDTLIKLTAYGFIRYWGILNIYLGYVWRKFELMLTIVSIADFTLNFTIGWTQCYFRSTIRDWYFIPIRLLFMMRNVRLLLIIQEFKGLSRLFRVLHFSLPFLAKILLLYLTILMAYGLLGCNLFGSITHGNIIDDYLNFTTFPKAMLTLFKCSTKNGWRIIMADSTSMNPYCKDDPTQCGHSWTVVILYYYTFTFIQGFIVLNLFVLALVEQFEKFYNSQNNVVQTYIENIDRFRTVWSKYSKETKGKKIHIRHLAHLLLDLGKPLGNNEGDNVWDAAYDAFNFHLIADANGFVHFQEVLYEIIKFAFKKDVFHRGTTEGILKMKEHDKDIRYKLHNKRKNLFIHRQSLPQKILKGNFNVMQDYIFLLTAFRTWTAYKCKLMREAGDGQNFTENIEESESSSDDHRIHRQQAVEDDDLDKISPCKSVSIKECDESDDHFQIYNEIESEVPQKRARFSFDKRIMFFPSTRNSVQQSIVQLQVLSPPQASHYKSPSSHVHQGSSMQQSIHSVDESSIMSPSNNKMRLL